MPPPAPTSFLERDAEVELLGRLLGDARSGRGVAVFVEAPAGHGKTTLLRVLRERGAAEGFRVLHATGAELDRDFAFGLVRQLFEATLHQAEGERRARLLDGPAELAESIFTAAALSAEAGPDVAHMRRHALYWLAANLAEETPLVICVDDAHWGDAPSLRALDVIARRIGDLPVLLAVGARPGELSSMGRIVDLPPPARIACRPQSRPQSFARDFGGGMTFQSAMRLALLLLVAFAALLSLGGASTASAATRSCAQVNFTPDSDDLAGNIRVSGVSCKYARDFIEDSEGRPAKRFRGFTCTRAKVETDTLPYTRYRCERPGDLIKWRRY